MEISVLRKRITDTIDEARRTATARRQRAETMRAAKTGAISRANERPTTVPT